MARRAETSENVHRTCLSILHFKYNSGLMEIWEWNEGKKAVVTSVHQEEKLGD